MKLISLNTYFGKIEKPLLEFLQKNKECDIWCFQEMCTGDPAGTIWADAQINQLANFKKALPEHQCFFSSQEEVGNFATGLAIFVRNNIKVNEFGEKFVHKSRNSMGKDTGNLGRQVQYVTLTLNNGKRLTVINFHGLWFKGQDKNDIPERLNQSKKIREFIDSIPGEKIFCGDFNLRPDTESIKIIEKDYINLIKKYQIQDTRSQIYKVDIRSADYILISPGISPKKLELPKIVVSDHLPLIFDFNL
jgi:endonuclease/exonuclease/phosphatase family metal-dependent hydrolase